MRKTEQLRVPVHPGLKEVLRTVASKHGLSLAEFVKTETSYRTVPLHPQLREILEAYRRVFFDTQPAPTRRSGRAPATLDRLDRDRFIEWRRAGTIPGLPRPVRSQSVRYDLQYTVAVLNWGVGVGHLASNPWGGRRGIRMRPFVAVSDAGGWSSHGDSCESGPGANQFVP